MLPAAGLHPRTQTLSQQGHACNSYPCASKANRKTAVFRRLRRPRQSGCGPPRTSACSSHGEVQILRAAAPSDGTLGELLSELSGLPTGQIQALSDLGAVYYRDFNCPPKWRRAKTLGEGALDTHIAKGQWVRIHPHPRRYPAASTTDWASRVLHLDDDVCVVNKPAGIPVQSHESNSAETVPRCMERALGIESLWMLHRLDWCTTGVLVLGRTQAVGRRFMADMAAHHIRKQYKALTHLPIEAGSKLEHYMYNGPFGSSLEVMAGEGLRARGPRLLSTLQLPKWKHCSLQVTDCKEMPLPRQGAAGEQWLASILERDMQLSMRTARDAHEAARIGHTAQRGPAAQAQTHERGSSTSAVAQQLAPHHGVGAMAELGTAAKLPSCVYECTVDLSSGGRTHQIRAQLSATGLPLLGDAMYAPIAGLTVAGGIANEQLRRRVDECLQVEGQIGLHAHQMTWEGRTFTAPPPWA